VFDKNCLALMRCELENLNYDGTVDYHEFVNSFSWGDDGDQFVAHTEIKISEQSATEFEILLVKINKHCFG
jgi:hypothetical protein